MTRLTGLHPVQSLRARLQAHLPAGSLRGRLARGALWVTAGSAVATLAGAAGSIFTARVMGKVGFGEWAAVFGTVTMFNVVAELSLGVTASKHVAEFRATDPQRAGRVVGLAYLVALASGTLMAALVAAFAAPLAAGVLEAPHLTPYVRYTAPLLMFAAVTGVQTGVLWGLEAFKRAAAARLVLSLVTTAATVTGAALGGLMGLAIAAPAAAAFGLVCYGRVVRRECAATGITVHYRGVWGERGILWRFSVPSVLAGMMHVPVVWAAAALLVRSPGGLGEMGAYNAASQWRVLVAFVPSALSSIALPMLSQLLGQGQTRRFVRALWMNIAVNVAAGTVVAIPISAAAYWIMSAYGPGFAEHWPALVAMCVVAVLQAANGVVAQALVSTGRMWWGFALNAVWAVELLAATWLLLPLGATGLALAHLVSYLLHTLQVGAYVVFALRTHVAREALARGGAAAGAAAAGATESEAAAGAAGATAMTDAPGAVQKPLEAP